ncbi:MAG: amidohydrolase family protein, partial [Bdellovibrionales bacterium]
QVQGAGEKIDLRDRNCLPGLIDTHVHFEQSFPDINFFHHPDEARTVMDAYDAPRRTLLAGFTTVRDLKSLRNVAMEFRIAVANGRMLGPRILTVGSAVISAPGGHGDSRSKIKESHRPGARELYSQYYGLRFVSSPEDVVDAFRFYLEERPLWYTEYPSSAKESYLPDAIKIHATGGVVSDNPDSHRRQLNRAIIEKAVQSAREYRERTGRSLTVAAHAHGIDGIWDAVMAGVDSVEHITELGGLIVETDDQKKWEEMRAQIAERMKENKIYGIPTLLAAQTVVDLAEDGKFPPHIAEKALAVGKRMLANFHHIVELGIPLAFGSDTGISPHGENWKELVLLVQHGKAAGLNEARALQMATIEAARALRFDAEIGSLDVGKNADIIAVDKNILSDISAIQHLSLIMKDGRVIQ